MTIVSASVFETTLGGGGSPYCSNKIMFLSMGRFFTPVVKPTANMSAQVAIAICSQIVLTVADEKLGVREHPCFSSNCAIFSVWTESLL